jgi:hypothetical protein
MGGLWVDYNLMSNVPGLFVLGRGELLRPRREPARRERAHAGARGRLLRDPAHHRELPRGVSRDKKVVTRTTRPFVDTEREVKDRLDRS